MKSPDPEIGEGFALLGLDSEEERRRLTFSFAGPPVPSDVTTRVVTATHTQMESTEECSDAELGPDPE